MSHRWRAGPRALRWLSILDLVAVPVLILLYIWRWQFTRFDLWMIFPIWLGASFLLHRDTPKTLGWRADNWKAAGIESAIFFGAATAALLAAALARGVPHPLAWRAIGEHLWNYFAFCLLQQVALNSLVNNRAIALFPQPWLSSLVTGVIFAAAHWPNPVLVPVTLAGGVAMAWLFRRNRNILTLALGQAVVGSLLALAFPARWIHNLRVGPGYYRWN